MTNSETLNRIAEALLVDYSSVYYVDAVTNEYRWYSVDPKFNSLHIEQEGRDFFENMKRDAAQVVYEDDKYIFMQEMQKESLLAAMKTGSMKRFEYRLMINGEPVYHTIRVIRGVSGDGENDYFILGVLNIDREVRERQKNEIVHKEREVYNQIAESLASNYDVIYYVDRANNSYSAYTTNSLYGQLEVNEEGIDFFAEAKVNIGKIVYPGDRERLETVLDRDALITQLGIQRKYTVDYRLVVDGRTQYTRFTAMWSSSKDHIIIGVENVDAEIQKEKEHLKALNSEKELARRDDLTGAKNKTAYQELVRSVQDDINEGVRHLSFAVVVCDINGLKLINDTEGHQAGDEYIRRCAGLICNTFVHSPVFRIGGDEFVVFIVGSDYAYREELFAKLRQQVLANKGRKGQPVVASGISAYDPFADKGVSDVFERADSMMYENKRQLKGE